MRRWMAPDARRWCSLGPARPLPFVAEVDAESPDSGDDSGAPGSKGDGEDDEGTTVLGGALHRRGAHPGGDPRGRGDHAAHRRERRLVLGKTDGPFVFVPGKLVGGNQFFTGYEYGGWTGTSTGTSDEPFKGIVFKSGTLWAIITINFGGTVWMH